MGDHFFNEWKKQLLLQGLRAASAPRSIIGRPAPAVEPAQVQNDIEAHRKHTNDARQAFASLVRGR